MSLKSLHEKRKTILGVDKKSSIYNSWRSKVYSKKGKLIGFPDTWRTFEGFKKDIPEGFEEGLILMRKDSTIPFSKENSYWCEKSFQQSGKLIQLEYNGETKTLLEWSHELNLHYNGTRQRYFKGKNYTPEQILFGKPYKPKGCPTDILELSLQKKKDKISKMLSAYKYKDKVKGFTFDLDKPFMEKLMSEPCHYCGDTKLIGSDRISNLKGHTKDNVLPCCYTCNIIRQDLFSVEEMEVLGKTIKLIKQNRQNDTDN